MEKQDIIEIRYKYSSQALVVSWKHFFSHNKIPKKVKRQLQKHLNISNVLVEETRANTKYFEDF